MRTRPRSRSSRTSSACCCCRAIPTTARTSSSRSAALPVVKRRTCSPAICSRCTSGMRSGPAGSSSCSGPSRPISAGSRPSRSSLQGDSAWTRMKHEGGPHRVQRVPVTESQGRVHTSAATVTVLPEADEIEVDVDPNDLQVDVYRSSGPGGQSVNTTDSAVRITHKPTGIVVSMQDQKSQLQNKAKAMQVLRARLLQSEQDRQRTELSDARRGADRRRRPVGEDPHVQLQGESRQRSSHRSHAVQARQGVAGRPRRDHRRARGRRAQSPTASEPSDASMADRSEPSTLARVARRGHGSACRGRACPSPGVDARRLVEQASGAEGSELALVLDTPGDAARCGALRRHARSSG